MRRYYIDNLRTFSILLLIPYHASMAWNTWGEPNYITLDANKAISSIVVFLSPYYMPLLFLLAGTAAKLALGKRTYGQYVYERCKKLLLTSSLGIFFLMPVMTYIADKYNFGYAGNMFSHYRVFFTKITDLTGADGGFSIGQFWFTVYLFVISAVSISVIVLLQKETAEPRNAPLYVICLSGVPLLFLSDILSVGGKSLAEYTYLFLLGYFLFSNEAAIDKISRHSILFLSVGVVSALLNTYLFVWSDTAYPLINTAAKTAAEWFMLLALMGIGKRYLNFSGRILSRLAHQSFLFYIFHYIWVVLFQYLLYGICGSNTAALYIMTMLTSYAATFLCCIAYERISKKIKGRKS